MKVSMSKRAVSVTLAGLLALGGTGVAGATIVNIDGGTWDYGDRKSVV